MQQDWFADVMEFMRVNSQYIGSKPAEPPGEVRALRAALDDEEWRELRQAILDGHLELVADSIVDLIYVLIGRAISYGIDLRPLWDAVHRANMAKAAGPVREDGKRLKPEGWEPPPIAKLLMSQVPLS